MSNDNTNYKTCTKCGQTFPATTKYFLIIYGEVSSLCLECRNPFFQAFISNIKDRNKKYRLSRKEKIQVYHANYFARKRQLPDTLTKQEWLTCLEYFNYACAVCGISFDDTIPHADHWIPLASDKCTGTVATNMICLCKSCNSSKNSRMPDVWLEWKYGIHQANVILKRIETYFESIAI